MTSSCPQNKNRYWSTIVCTMSSKWGRIASNFPRSPNSYCNKVGHQQIAKFLLSIQLSLLDSVTLQFKIKFVKFRIQKSVKSLLTYLTKCWKMNFRTAKLVFGNRLINLPNSSTLILRSGITVKKCINLSPQSGEFWVVPSQNFISLNLLDMVSSSAIWSSSKIGGNLLKKKSLTAVATAFTAMSSSSISTFGSSSNFWNVKYFHLLI